MALVMTALQQDSSSNSAPSSSVSEEDLNDEMDEDLGELPVLKPSPKHPTKRLLRQGSISENFFAVKGASMILPRQTSLAVQNVEILKKYGGELQTHLRAIFHHLRPQDNIKLAVRLESWEESHRRYLVVVSTTGRQDTEESIIVGCDFDSSESTTCTIGLVLPVWCDTDIRLDGDGGFHVECREIVHTFKPVSVQAMWSALQSLNRCVEVARKNNYFEGSLFLTWTGFYSSKTDSSRLYVNEWMFRDDLLGATKDKYKENPDPERLPVEQMIRNKLKKVMMGMDLDNCTSKDIRLALEGEISIDLKDYKEYIDQEMLTVLGQMDCASKILDYLYLGSEWNACNLEELEVLGITHILNVTVEIDNFFPEVFKYKSVRVYDLEETDLLPHWNHTWKFIAEAKKSGGKCLVHCRMGISRSAATVCAYLMKQKLWSKAQAIEHVKSCRSIISPNSGFQKQLDEYQGIVYASSHRHNEIFRSRSESSLVETGVNEDRKQASTKATPPVIQIADVNEVQHDVTDGQSDDFDLNRHLLDIASLSTPKVSRPKSWSPNEGRAPYVPNKIESNRLESYSYDTPNHSSHSHNLSETLDPLLTPGGDGVRNGRVQELRRNFTHKRPNLRRQTAEAAVMVDDVFAQSDDIVFVHDGSTPLKSKKHRDPPRSSSPAALGIMMSPPREDPTSNPARINDDSTEGIVKDDDVSKSLPQEEKRSDDSATKESGSGTFVKGHHKTLSLPPTASEPPPSATQDYALDDDDVTQSRSRSCSDAPTSVKQIVTAIENLQSPEAENGEGMKRSASLPSWRKKGGCQTNFTLASERIIETEAEKTDQSVESSFFIGDSEDENTQSEAPSNLNANNNNNSLSAVPEVYCQASAFPQSLKEEIHTERSRMSPEVLHMIREIGVHLEKEENCNLSTCSPNAPTSATNKKRGVVRQMVKEIEKGVRKLTGKGVKSEKKAKAAKPEALTIHEATDPKALVQCKNLPGSLTAEVPSLPESTFSNPPTPGIELLTPPPYRTPDTLRATSPGKARFKLSIRVPKVRRTQSERAAQKPQTFKKPGYFRSFKTTQSNLSTKESLPTESTSVTASESMTKADDVKLTKDSSERRSSSGDTSLLVTSPLSFHRALSSPHLVSSTQSTSNMSPQQNFITSQRVNQIRS